MYCLILRAFLTVKAIIADFYREKQDKAAVTGHFSVFLDRFTAAASEGVQKKNLWHICLVKKLPDWILADWTLHSWKFHFPWPWRVPSAWQEAEDSGCLLCLGAIHHRGKVMKSLEGTWGATVNLAKPQWAAGQSTKSVRTCLSVKVCGRVCAWEGSLLLDPYSVCN